MKEIKVGDFVEFIPNGLIFRVENQKMLNWMILSGLYIKQSISSSGEQGSYKAKVQGSIP
jgi:hypothetical protein